MNVATPLSPPFAAPPESPSAGKRLRRMARDYERIALAIRFLDAHFRERPGLATVARAVHLSPYHFQRLFSRWAGISPTRFLHAISVAQARRLLQENESVLGAALDAGLSGPGRLHDLLVAHEAVSPGEMKSRGEGLTIRWAVHPGPFGPFALFLSPRGICGLSFIENDEKETLAAERDRWPRARFVHDPAATAPWAARIFLSARDQEKNQPVPLHLSGTNFQVQVWRALLSLPRGRVVSYNDVARLIGRAGCPRAIGNAMAANPIGFLIPCHRVIRATGAFNDYRWGIERRKAIIGWEAARADS